MMKPPCGMRSEFHLPRPILSQYELPKPTSKPPLPTLISINIIPPPSSSSSSYIKQPIKPSSSSSLSPVSTPKRKRKGEGPINVAAAATSNNYNSSSSSNNNDVLTSEEEEEEEEEGGFILVTKRVVGTVLGVGLIVVVMGGAGIEKAWAVGPEGPLMEEFWENLRRYGIYFLTVSTGALYTVFQPISELLKSPVSAILVLTIMAGSFYVVSQVLSAMTGLSGFSYDYGY